MKKLTKTIIVIIILALTLSLFGLLEEAKCEKKAIIMLPGFMGSLLIDEKNIYWMTFPINDDYKPPRLSKKPVLNRLLETLIMDEEGNRKVEMYPATMQDMDLIGGTFNEYLYIFTEMQQRFSNEYDVINFQYDWMKSDLFNAKELDAFISQNKYTEVVLLAHSMGGLVADNYLSLGSEQRDKISLFATFGSPHGGVLDALVVLESKTYAGIPAILSALLGDKIFDIARNMPSLLQMLPNEILLSSPYYKNAEAGHKSFIRIETEKGVYEYLTEWEDIVNFYATREWAKYITDTSKSGELKQMFVETLEMFDRMYYQNDNGTYEHISEKVNSYYFVGMRPNSSKYACMQYNLNGTVSWINEKNYSDGTVSAPSAAAGFPLNHERVIYKNGYSHSQIFNEVNEAKETPLDILEQKLNEIQRENK